MMGKTKFCPGDRVYVVEWDMFGCGCDMAYYMYIAETENAVIVSPYIEGHDTFDEIIQSMIDETCNYTETSVCVFPIEDCYHNEEEVRIAISEKA